MQKVLPWITVLSVFTWLLGCDPAPAAAPPETPEEALGPNAAIIRNPVGQGGDLPDTARIARMTFSETVHRFGEVDAGTLVKHDFAFVNTGTVPLLITKARSTCGCTVPSYPEEPIPPGDGGTISVVFDTKNKHGRQRKPVTITANTYPAMSTIYVDGHVINE